MKKLNLFALIILFLANQLPAQAIDQNTADVVCFGDSITKRGYPKILASLIEVKVINAGVSGHTSSEGLRRMSRDVLAHRPKVVVIAFGTNDIRVDNKKKHTSLEQYEKNLLKMIQQCSGIDARVVLTTVPPVKSEPFFKRHEKKVFDEAGGLTRLLSDRRTVVLRLARKHKIPVVDLHTLLPKEPNWLSPDGVHPSPEGNGIIARHVAKAVIPLLKAE